MSDPYAGMSDKERAIAIQKDKKAKKVPKAGAAGPPNPEQLAALRAQKALLKQQKEECEARGETWVPPPAGATSVPVAVVAVTDDAPAPAETTAFKPPPPQQQQLQQQPISKQSAASLTAEANKAQKIKNQLRDAAGGSGSGGASKSSGGGSSTTHPHALNRIHLFDHLPRKEEQKSSHFIESQYALAAAAGGVGAGVSGGVGGMTATTTTSTSSGKPGKGGSVQPEYPIHPATVKLGVYFRRGLVREDDDRVVALISALKTIVSDYVTPPKKSLAWDLDKFLSAQVQYLIHCRQHSIGMGNIIKYLRYTISQIPPDCSESKAKAAVADALSQYLAERIINSRNCISQDVCFPAIKEHDVILTFGTSPLVRQILLETAAQGRRFRVIVVDARPLNDGKITMKACADANIPCMYTNLAGVNFVMDQATRVLLGTSAVLSNGAVLAPAGTAMIASIAKAHRVPTMFAAESYKFSFKVQLDSIVHNELGSIHEIVVPNAICSSGAGAVSAAGAGGGASASEGEDGDQGVTMMRDEEGNGIPAYSEPQRDGIYKGAASALDDNGKGPYTLPYSVINLRYDLTPICNVSVVATESGLIPPTSIPILIKEYNKQQGSAAGGGATATAMNSLGAAAGAVAGGRSASPGLN